MDGFSTDRLRFHLAVSRVIFTNLPWIHMKG